MKRILLIVGFLLALGAPSYAASCAGTFQIKDNAAATGTVVYTDSGDGSGNCVPDVKVFGTAPVSVGSGGIASGAIASGAVASGAIASGALASGAGTDGWNATLGAKADTVCATATGTCSEIALLKYLNSAVAGSIPAGSNVIGKTGIDQTTFGTTNGVVSAANTYNTIAASQTAQALTGGSGGATGDYLSHCVVLPTSTSPGVVTILDNSTAIFSFPGGASSTSNLVPFTIPVGAVSTSGAWKVTTGANLTVTCVGKFH